MFRKYVPESLKAQYRLLRARLMSVGLTRRGVFEQSEEEKQASGNFSVIIPIHGGTEVVRRCLSALEMYGGYAEIIPVDDGSPTQDTVDAIREYELRNGWKVVRHEKPKGVSRAVEAGASVASRPYLCILNSDAIVTQHTWSAPTRAFASDAKVAVTGPSTSWAGTPQAVKRARHCRLYWNDSQICAFAEQYVKEQKGPNVVDLRFIHGFAFFIRKAVWDDIGGFDKGLPDYGNETELCIRLSKAGWRLVWTKDSFIHHIGNHSYTETRTAKVARAMAYIRAKHGDSVI